MTTLTVNANDMMQSLVVKIEMCGLRRLKWRLRLAALVFRLGAWVAGIQIKINPETGEVSGGEVDEI